MEITLALGVVAVFLIWLLAKGGRATAPYWPSYSSISPECRAAYLDWLATGRRHPRTYIGYVFLYFYGLERRALAQAPGSEQAKRDLPFVIGEVEQLLQVYNPNGSFRGYATQFLDVLRMLAAEGDDIKPPTERTGYELPFSLPSRRGPNCSCW
jgi:hypothetical protein